MQRQAPDLAAEGGAGAVRPDQPEEGREPLFLRACRNRAVERTPVWFMRQAGRSLPEYRALRAGKSLLESCRAPEVAAEVTLQPVRRLGVDAAIFFSDIVLPLAAAGVALDIVPEVGPVIAEPLRSAADIERLPEFDAARDAPYLAEAIGMVVAESPVPVIGFAGGPFTLASYLIEGGPSKTHARTRTLMYGDREMWMRLMERLADVAIASLRAQVQAGARAVQLFDSWSGVLDPISYADCVLPAVRRIFASLEDLAVPRIIFGVGTGELLELMAQSGAEVVGVDWRVPIERARLRLGDDVVLQGNLDPVACLAPWPRLQPLVDRVLDGAGDGGASAASGTRGGAGHIFNLGHGVLPETDPENLKRIVDYVHERTGRGEAFGSAESRRATHSLPQGAAFGANQTGDADAG